MKHTKGPWNTRYQIDILTRAAEGLASGMIAGESQGNLYLITQAPTLLKAVKLALLEFDRISYQKKANPEIIELLEHAVKLASGEVKHEG